MSGPTNPISAAACCDHVSLVTPPLELERHGFRVTPTSGAEGAHARVHLDRMYLEVALATDATTVRAEGWFLRPVDLGQAAERLRQAGFAVHGLTRYDGYDGSWDDVEVRSEELGGMFPVLTRRVDSGAVGWPPPLAEPHPNRVVAIAAIEVTTRSPAAFRAALITLGAVAAEDALLLAGGVRVTVSATRGVDGIAGLEFLRADATTWRPTLWERDTS